MQQVSEDALEKEYFVHPSGLKTSFDLVRPAEDPNTDTILVYFHGNQLSCRDKKARFALAKALGF